MAIDIQRAEVLLPTDRRSITIKTNVDRTTKPSTKTGHLHRSVKAACIFAYSDLRFPAMVSVSHTGRTICNLMAHQLTFQFSL